MGLNLKLKYFVSFDQLMGKTEYLEIPDGASVADLLAVLAGKYSGFLSAQKHIVILKNGLIIAPDHKLASGDEISILTPQLGG